MAKKRRGSPSSQPQRGALPPKTPDQEERDEYAFWTDEIKRAKKANDKWFEQVKAIQKLYKDDRPATPDGAPTQHRMNILWSNVQVLQPSFYSKTPQPNVSRRFLNKDPVSRCASLIAERNLITAIEMCDFDYPMKRVRDDFIIGGRGVPWVRYAPEFAMLPLKEPVTAIQLQGTNRTVYRPISGGDEIPADKVKDDDEIGQYYETEPVEQVLAYGLDIDHVALNDFLHEIVGDWTKVGWVGRRALMKRGELKREFKKLGAQVELNKSSTGDDAGTDKGKSDCAEVWEIWAKGSRQVVWLTDGLPERLLRKEPDPLRLSGFWPCPRPILGTTTTDSLIPVPDYVLYQDQAAQIDKLTDRIRVLTAALRVVGVYNAQSAALATLMDEASENEMVPVDNWVWFSGTGGLKGNIDWFPVDQISTVLMALFQARSQLRNDLYEVTGISDIIRGVSDPNATATAEQIKSNFGSLRLQDKQSEMARIARDTMRIMAEVQCEHYPDEVLVEMSGIAESDEFIVDPADPQAARKQQAAQAKLMAAVKMLKDDKLRTFKIDIETDATVAADQQKEKETRVEFLTAVAPFIEKAAQVGMTAPQFVPLLLKMLDYGVRGFRTGRTLESAIDETIETAEKMLAAAQAAPQGAQAPDPAAEAQAAELKAKAEKAQHELQQAQADAVAKQQENSAKALAMQETAAKQAQVVNLQIENLKADIEKRRQDNERAAIQADLDVKIKTLQIQELESKLGAAAIQGMTPAPEANEAEVVGQQAALADAKTRLAEAQVRYAEITKRGAGLGALGEALEDPAMSPANIGTPIFGQPKKRTMKMHQFTRDPETNAIIGGVTHEIEVGDEGDGETPAPTTPTPVPTEEAA